MSQSLDWNSPFSLPTDDQPISRYARLRLKRNPFPSVGVAPDSPTIEPPPAVVAELRKVLQDFIDNRGNQYILILGEYGYGKTHALRSLQERMRRNSFPMDPKIVYIASAGFELYSLIRNILDGFGRDELAKTVWQTILDDFREHAKNHGHNWVAEHFSSPKEADLSRQSLFGGDNLSDTVLQSGWNDDHFLDYRQFLQEFAKRKLSLKRLREYAIGVLVRVLECSAFLASELYDSTDSDIIRAQTAWDKLTIPGERGAPYKEQQEWQVMRTLLLLVELTGNYDSLVLLVDEFESVFATPGSRGGPTAKYQRSLRHLLDQVSGAPLLPLMVVLAVNTSSYDAIRSVYPPLDDRLMTKIMLPSIDSALARSIISSYLQQERISVQEKDPPLFPFTEEAVDAILAAIPTKSVRELILYARRAVEYLANNEAVALPIDASDVAAFVPRQDR